MCGIYSHRYACLSYKIGISICHNVFLCINLTFTSTLGCGDVKGVLNYSSTKPCASPRFTWYTRVYYINTVWSYLPVTNL